MKEIGKIILYLVATVVLAALIAPPLYHAGQSFEFLQRFEFQKFFNRSVLVAAVLLLWPTVLWLRVGGWKDLGIEPDSRRWSHFAVGFSIAAFLVAAMSGSYIALEFYEWKKKLPWGALPKLAVSALVVAILEELLFRGAILGLFRRSLRPYAALFWTTALFAILHFLKPDEDVTLARVEWHSGFFLLQHVFHQFAEPMMVLSGFTTIFVLGWVAGYAVIRTRSLWMSIGLHAGVVFVKMAFSKFTKRQEEFLPWVGPELQIGLVPVLALALAGIFVWGWLNYEDANRTPPRS